MKFLQDRQCTYNVTVTRILVTTVEVEKQKYYIFRVCVCSLSYAACNGHAPFSHLWPATFYSSRRHDFPKKLL